MKFYNSITQLKYIDTDYVIVNNTNEQAILIITIQVVNNNQNNAIIKFKVKNSDDTSTPYVSSVNVNTGTTIIDHLIVVSPNTKYVVSSNSENIVISCSYGI